jgi:hypothetical protein
MEVEGQATGGDRGGSPPARRSQRAKRRVAYMNCPRCGLSIRLRASYLTLESCPRCLARRYVAVQMFVSDRPGRCAGRGCAGSNRGRPVKEPTAPASAVPLFHHGLGLQPVRNLAHSGQRVGFRPPAHGEKAVVTGAWSSAACLSFAQHQQRLSDSKAAGLVALGFIDPADTPCGGANSGLLLPSQFAHGQSRNVRRRHACSYHRSSSRAGVAASGVEE